MSIKFPPGFTPEGEEVATMKNRLAFGRFERHPAVAKRLEHPDPYWRKLAAREIECYRLFRKKAPPFRIPKVRFADVRRGWLVLDRLEGRPLGMARYAEGPVPPDELAMALDYLEKVPRYDQWPRSKPEETAFIYREKLKRHIAEGRLAESDMILLDRLLDEPPAAVFQHGDAVMRNFLLTPAGMVLLDWEFCGRYLPGYDLAILWVMLAKDMNGRLATSARAERWPDPQRRAFGINLLMALAREIQIGRKDPALASIPATRLYEGLGHARRLSA